jgi:protein arginine kinase
MDLSRLAHHAGEWLRGTGADSDIVISCRVRLARNVPDTPFVGRCTPEQKNELAEMLSRSVLAADIGDSPLYLPLGELGGVDRTLLVERHLISTEHAEAEGARGVVFNTHESTAVMINEEDHLRIQVFCAGFQPEQVWARVDALDDRIGERIDYAYSEQLGYLTACPTNVGTGLRASVMLHLPALGMTRQIEQVVHAVQKMGLAVRGLYGEGTQALGGLYQVSNQVTLGKSETEIIDSIASTIPTIVRMERDARRALLDQHREQIEDKVWRSLGVLQSARLVSSTETLEHLSQLRLGVNVGLVKSPDLGTINQLFILTLPAHLQKLEGRELEPRQRDRVRASLIRQTLEGGGTMTS